MTTRPPRAQKSLHALFLCLLVLGMTVGFAVGGSAQTLTAVSYSASTASSQPINTTIALTATATGGSNVQYRFLTGVASGDATTWTTLQAFSTTKTYSWKPTTPNTYDLRVEAREGASGEAASWMSASYLITPTPPSAVTLAASPASPQPVNTPITLTAAATGGTNVQYKFEVGTGTTTIAYTTLRDFGASATAAWTPTTAAAYTLRVTAREQGLPLVTVTKTLTYTITPALTAVALAASPTSPRPINTSITLTATATGGASVQYQFQSGVASGETTTWTTLQAYGATATYTWKPATAASYSLRAMAREGASGTPVTSAVATYLITPTPPTAVTLAASPVSPQPVNTAITLTAAATGGSTVQYKFEVGKGTTTITYTTLQDYSTSATATWTPTTAAAYTLRVTAREKTLPGTTVNKTLSYTITPALTAVALAASPAAPQAINTSITLTATATGGASVQYQFQSGVASGETTTWTTLQAYGATATYTWKPATAASYSLRALAREGASGTPVTSAVATYLITPTPPSAVTLTASPASPKPVNTAITLTSVATGGTNVQYKFEVGTGTTTIAYTTLRDFGASATATWTPTTAAAYTLRVTARESGLPATTVLKTLAYTITPALSAVSIAASPAAPQSINTSITLTATATGGAVIQYQFQSGLISGETTTWTTLQAYGATATYTWKPATAATYSLRVLAREGADGTPVTSATASYLITPAPPSAVTLTASPVSQQPVNTAITLTGAATGGTHVQYKFEVGKGTTTITYTTLQDFSSTATAAWTPTTAAAYTLRVTARESGLPATTVLKTLAYTITPALTAVTIAASPAAPKPVNTSITLTATATGGANVQYQFQSGVASGETTTWTTLQAFGAATTCSWKPTIANTYSLRAQAREGASGTPINSATASYNITGTPPSAVTLTASPVSPRPVNTTITLTGAATGGTNVQYKFEVGTGTTTIAYTTLRDFDTSATAVWTPTTAAAYTLRVTARETGLPATTVNKTLAYTITPVLSSVTLTTSLASPQPKSTSMTFTATAVGGANLQYLFQVGGDDGHGGITWEPEWSYGTSSTTTWSPYRPDTYYLRVTAREGASGITATSAVQTYIITPTPPSAVTLTASPASPRPVNTAITLTGAATGGTNVQYKFEVGTGTTTIAYTTLRDFASTATAAWTPTTAAAYTLRVTAREQGLPATTVTKTLVYTITPVLSTVALAVSPAAPQPINTSITLTATATGGANVQYQFQSGVASGETTTWTTLQAYSSTATYTWKPATAATYSLRVLAREGADGTPRHLGNGQLPGYPDPAVGGDPDGQSGLPTTGECGDHPHRRGDRRHERPV